MKLVLVSAIKSGYLKHCHILNNTDNLTTEQIDDLLLEKEKFWIGALVTQHSGMNCSHDWNRSRRSDKAPTINLTSDP